VRIDRCIVSKVIATHLYNYLFMKELWPIPVFRSDDTHTPILVRIIHTVYERGQAMAERRGNTAVIEQPTVSLAAQLAALQAEEIG
jgi:hypothetical protein